MSSTQNIRIKEGQKMTLEQLIDSYLRTCKLQGKTTATLKWYVRRLGHFKTFMQAKGHSMMAKDIELGDGEQYVIALMDQNHRWPQHPYSPPKPGGLSKFTVHGHVRAIRALMNWAMLNGYLKEDPFARLPVPKLPKKLIEVLSEEEIERLFKAADSLDERGVRVRTILMVLLDTAIRAEELCGLKMDAVDLDQGTIKVFGKGQKERIIPLGQATLQELHNYIHYHRPEPANPNIKEVFLSEDRMPLTYSALASIITRIKKRAKIPRLHLHLMRHTSLTMMVERETPAFVVQQMAGHTSIKTTEIYVHLAQQRTAAQYKKYSVVDGLQATQNRRHRGRKAQAH